MNIAIAQFLEPCRGAVGELIQALNRVHIGGDLRQHCGGVTGTGADLEDFFAALEHQGFCHEGDNVGLGNGLARANRERRVFVSEFAQTLRHEQLSRHLAHGVKHEFIADTARGYVLLDHLVAERSKGIGVSGKMLCRGWRSHDDDSDVYRPCGITLRPAQVRRIDGNKRALHSAAFCWTDAGRNGANSSEVNVSLAIRRPTPSSRSARRRSRIERALASPDSIRSRTARSISRSVASAALTTLSCTPGKKFCGSQE